MVSKTKMRLFSVLFSLLFVSASAFAMGKCAEGKCGEGKCGNDKKVEKTTDSNTTKDEGK